MTEEMDLPVGYELWCVFSDSLKKAFMMTGEQIYRS